MNSLVKVEPFRLPGQRRPGLIPSLPDWAQSRIGSLKENWQRDPSTGKWGSALTLPANMMLNEPQKAAIANYVKELQSMLDLTPNDGADAEAATLVILTRALKVLPAQKTDSCGYEARGEAYMETLDDVPFWATDEALRKWYRGDHGEKFDYQFMPAPAVIRKLAMNEVYLVRGRIRKLTGISQAVALMEFGRNHERVMKRKVDALFVPFNQ